MGPRERPAAHTVICMYHLLHEVRTGCTTVPSTHTSNRSVRGRHHAGVRRTVGEK